MHLNDYQEAVVGHAFYPEQGSGKLEYPLLALAGEVGELCNKYKKIMRADRSVEVADRQDLADELGDVLWYATAVAEELDTTLEAVCLANLDKLNGRRKEGLKSGKLTQCDCGAVFRQTVRTCPRCGAVR